MPPHEQPTSPLQAYRHIIDQLAAETAHQGPGKSVLQSGIYSKAQSHVEYNALLAQLTDAQRKLVSQMLNDCYSGAIHDVLALLEWWHVCREIEWTYKGEQIPLNHYDGMHVDYTTRHLGYPWPGEQDAPPSQANPKSQPELTQMDATDPQSTNANCPHCGQPCPLYRKTCKHCHKPVNAA